MACISGAVGNVSQNLSSVYGNGTVNLYFSRALTSLAGGLFKESELELFVLPLRRLPRMDLVWAGVSGGRGGRRDSKVGVISSSLVAGFICRRCNLGA